jgi:hypothetical protein
MLKWIYENASFLKRGVTMTRQRISMHALPGKSEEISPRKFELDGETIEVTETFESWQEDEKKHFFKVKGDNEQFYTLLFDEKKHQWYCE